jgi:hypothetical protein
VLYLISNPYQAHKKEADSLKLVEKEKRAAKAAAEQAAKIQKGKDPERQRKGGEANTKSATDPNPAKESWRG